METKKRKVYHNYNLYKVIATFYIAFLHFGIFNYFTENDYIKVFVEYFFIVSGIMLAKNYEENRVSPTTYMVCRYKRLYPEYLIFTIGYF